MPRRVTLVAVDTEGEVIGALDPFTVEPSWWNEVASVVEAVRADHGVDVTVLRLLEVESVDAAWNLGGSATYAVELHGAPPSGLGPAAPRAIALATADDPLRLPYARPGGPADELGWADAVLAHHGRAPDGPARQMRTWNLSSIWTIPTADGTVWLKSVPPFGAHEGATIEWLGEATLPPVLGAAPGRVLMADIAGDDHYDAALGTLTAAVSTLVAIQARVAGDLDALFRLGLPDWRWLRLRVLIDDVVARHGHELSPTERTAIDGLLDGYDARTAAIDACGLPVTLVHGDFHPGNLRGDPARPVLLDWGGCGVGHPLLDHAAMLGSLPADRNEPVRDHWARQWRTAEPGCDPERAAELLGPIAALRQAAVFRGFLDGIEVTERIYHAADPARWLRIAAAETC